MNQGQTHASSDRIQEMNFDDQDYVYLWYVSDQREFSSSWCFFVFFLDFFPVL